MNVSQDAAASTTTTADGFQPFAVGCRRRHRAPRLRRRERADGGRGRQRLTTFGPNEITAEKPPSIVASPLQQLRDPMNIMLVAVTVVASLIGEVSTGIIVALLIVLNIVLGSRQELKARASVDALSNLQVPQAKVVRDGALALVPGGRRRPRRPRPGRGRRHRAGRRADRPLGDARDAGSGAHRRERAGRQGRPRRCRPRRRARRPDQHAVPEHLGDPWHRRDGRDRDRHGDPDGPDRHDADARSRGPVRRCRRSSTP